MNTAGASTNRHERGLAVTDEVMLDVLAFFELCEFYVDGHGRIDMGHHPKAYNFKALVERFGIKEDA